MSDYRTDEPCSSPDSESSCPRCVSLERALRGTIAALANHDCPALYVTDGEPYVCDECDALVAAREALVGTREKDLGGSQSEPCAGERTGNEQSEPITA